MDTGWIRHSGCAAEILADQRRGQPPADPAAYLRKAANLLLRYLSNNGPIVTGRLRRSWRLNVGQRLIVVFSSVPWSYRILGDNRTGVNWALLGVGEVQNRFKRVSYRIQRRGGIVSISLRYEA